MKSPEEPAALSHLWSLDPAVTFLNHGSYGACPTAVLQEQQELRSRMEAEPVRFLSRELEPLLDQARGELGAFLSAPGDDLAFIPNATTGINAVLRSLTFGRGDELLTTNQEYNACRNVLDYVAERSGATVVVAPVPFPLPDPEALFTQVMAHVTPKTRLVLLDHVTSATALVFPIARLVAALNEKGIDALIDGAHAPGQIPLDLQQLGAAYYVGNCHKWLCAPKGSAFLYVRPDRQPLIHPATISHGRNSTRTTRSRFRLEFDWQGTDDPTAFLCVPSAIRHLAAQVPGGWPAIMQRNHDLAIHARQVICRRLDLPEPCPESLIGAMAAIPLPANPTPGLNPAWPHDPIQDELFDRYGIEVPVSPWPAPPARLLRVSAQLYNQAAHYVVLADALAAGLQAP